MSDRPLHRSKEQIDVLEDKGKMGRLILYNDDFNTFDWVIRCLMEVCDHTLEQAEQLTWLVHFKGKATVKLGVLPKIKPMKEALIDRGLSAVIEVD